MADTEENHEYKFINSTALPPSDALLEMILALTPNVTLVQPPFIDINEFAALPEHELEYLYMNDTLELCCLHFGSLMKVKGMSEWRV